jgi:hypothetical protein
MIVIKEKHSDYALNLLSKIAFNKNVFKELGYPIYSDEKHTWYFLFYHNKLIGFCASVIKKNYISFNHDYIIPEYRNIGGYNILFTERLIDCNCKIKAVATEKSINTFLRNKFKLTKKTNNYYFIEL